jgi:hypothetical protein
MFAAAAAQKVRFDSVITHVLSDSIEAPHSSHLGVV